MRDKDMQENPIMEFFDYEFNVEVDEDKVKEFQKISRFN